MRALLLVSILTLSLFAEVSYRGNVGIEGENSKSYNAFSYRGDAELTKEWGDMLLGVGIKAIYDFEDEERREFKANELYMSYFLENSEMTVGKKVKFFGNLEAFNVVDIYNPKDMLYSPFEKEEKIGSIAASYAHYVGDGKLEVSIKAREEERGLQSGESFYNLFGDLEYRKKLEGNLPSIFLSYLSSYDFDVVGGDFGLIASNGFDPHRSYYFDGTKMREKIERANSIGFFGNMVYGEMILKFESLYSNLQDDAKNDYIHTAFGVERTFYRVIKKADIKLFAEHYNLAYVDKNEEEINELFNHDIFLGVRLDVNDQDSGIVQLGYIRDLESSEEIWRLECESRLLESFSAKLEVDVINSGDDRESYLYGLGSRTVAKINFQYNF